MVATFVPSTLLPHQHYDPVGMQPLQRGRASAELISGDKSSTSGSSIIAYTLQYLHKNTTVQVLRYMRCKVKRQHDVKEVQLRTERAWSN